MQERRETKTSERVGVGDIYDTSAMISTTMRHVRWHLVWFVLLCSRRDSFYTIDINNSLKAKLVKE